MYISRQEFTINKFVHIVKFETPIGRYSLYVQKKPFPILHESKNTAGVLAQIHIIKEFDTKMQNSRKTKHAYIFS